VHFQMSASGSNEDSTRLCAARVCSCCPATVVTADESADRSLSLSLSLENNCIDQAAKLAELGAKYAFPL